MMNDFLKNDKTKYFALGVVATTAGVKFLKSKMFRDGCVKTVAEGMRIRNEAAATIAKIKEDAEDICFDANIKAECDDEE